MIAVLRLFNLDVFQTVLVEEMARKLRAAAGIAIRRFGVSGEDTFHPDARCENDRDDNKDDDEEVHARILRQWYAGTGARICPQLPGLG